MEESQVLNALSALSQETRLRIVRYLVSRGDHGAPAGEIGDHVGASSSRLSFHLSALERAGLIGSQRASRSIIYRANVHQLGNMIGYLLKDCCMGHPVVMQCCRNASAL